MLLTQTPTRPGSKKKKNTNIPAHSHGLVRPNSPAVLSLPTVEVSLPFVSALSLTGLITTGLANSRVILLAVWSLVCHLEKILIWTEVNGSCPHWYVWPHSKAISTLPKVHNFPDNEQIKVLAHMKDRQSWLTQLPVLWESFSIPDFIYLHQLPNTG